MVERRRKAPVLRGRENANAVEARDREQRERERESASLAKRADPSRAKRQVFLSRRKIRDRFLSKSTRMKLLENTRFEAINSALSIETGDSKICGR